MLIITICFEAPGCGRSRRSAARWPRCVSRAKALSSATDSAAAGSPPQHATAEPTIEATPPVPPAVQTQQENSSYLGSNFKLCWLLYLVNVRPSSHCFLAEDDALLQLGLFYRLFVFNPKIV